MFAPTSTRRLLSVAFATGILIAAAACDTDRGDPTAPQSVAPISQVAAPRSNVSDGSVKLDKKPTGENTSELTPEGKKIKVKGKAFDAVGILRNDGSVGVTLVRDGIDIIHMERAKGSSDIVLTELVSGSAVRVVMKDTKSSTVQMPNALAYQGPGSVEPAEGRGFSRPVSPFMASEMAAEPYEEEEFGCCSAERRALWYQAMQFGVTTGAFIFGCIITEGAGCFLGAAGESFAIMNVLDAWADYSNCKQQRGCSLAHLFIGERTMALT